MVSVPNGIRVLHFGHAYVAIPCSIAIWKWPLTTDTAVHMYKNGRGTKYNEKGNASSGKIVVEQWRAGFA